MKIIDILNKKSMSLSFEVFPPKKETSFESVKETTEKIAESKPAFMSVTYGAGGGTSRFTLDIAKTIEEKHGVPTMAHLTCVSSSKDMIHSKIEEIHSLGLQNIMALRGDLTPELENTDRSTWDYRHAVELIREIKESGYDFCIGGACYPEVHPESANQHEDIKYLKEKVDAGADFLVSQMVFDNNLFYNFLYKIREAGITVPVVPGIMPITTAKQLSRSVQLSGTSVPERFKAIVDRFGDDPVAMRQAGIIYATEQIIDLIANGITHIHVYSMNKPDVASDILYNLKGIID